MPMYLNCTTVTQNSHNPPPLRISEASLMAAVVATSVHTSTYRENTLEGKYLF